MAYYGLTLEADGLHLYNGVENARVLAANPMQTWSFYTRCPLVMDHESILDTTWSFAQARAMRTVIAREGQRRIPDPYGNQPDQSRPDPASGSNVSAKPL